MDLEQVKHSLQEVFDTVFKDPPKLREDLTAPEVPEWDSLKHLSLIFAVEGKFNIRFSLTQIHQLKNVGELLNLIVAMTSGRS